ncbi:MAG: AraC family transcriptional regulator [Clostridia bacterium]|nr:AraC family transcriptional regulator [Clostridia bacterium]
MSNLTEGDRGGVELLFPSHEVTIAVPLSDLYPIEAILVGMTHPFPNYRVRRRPNGKTYLLEHVLEGKGEFRAGGRTQRIGGGDTFLIDKDDPHDFGSDRGEPLKKIFISFASDYLGKMLEAYRLGTGVYRADVRAEFSALYATAEQRRSPQSQFYEIAGLLHAILLKLSRSVQEEERGISAIKQALLSAVYTKKTLDEVAGELFMSRSNLIRLFKRETGETPYRFLLNERIAAAKSLLATTTMPVRAIAELLCFTDEHYFSFLFKEKTGMTPSRYRATFR